MDFFYRNHRDTIHSSIVPVLTEAGLAKYIDIRMSEEPELTKNIKLIIDYDINATPEFSRVMQKEIKKNLLSSSNRDRISFIIHRDIHTVGLIKEKDKFLLLDSYNAHGTDDCEHIPLLKIIRELFPYSKIYTLHDKMQKDFCNCRIFSVENIIEIERFCKFHNCGLSEVIDSNKNIYFSDFDQKKDIDYRYLNISSIATPLPIISKIQSLKQIKKITNDFRLLKVKRNKLETYFDYLNKNINIDKYGKEINRTIENQSLKTRNQISRFQKILNIKIGKNNDKISQESFVKKLQINKNILELKKSRNCKDK